MEIFLCLVTLIVTGFASGEESSSSSGIDMASTVKLLQEQVSALLEHRQEEYNALEESLKRAMEKNTELIVLKNEVKFLRYLFFSSFFFTFLFPSYFYFLIFFITLLFFYFFFTISVILCINLFLIN